MGFIRGVGVVIFSVLLFLSFLAAGVCLTLGLSLNYENVQPTVVSLSTTVISQTTDLNVIVEEASPLLQAYCINNSEYVFNEAGQTFVIPCSVVNQGDEAIVSYLLNESVTGAVEDYYYKDYNCTFVQCIKKGEITSLISEKARNYWMSKFYMFLIISGVIIALLFLLTEKMSGWFILVGSLLVIDSLIISKLNVVGGWVAKTLLTSIKEIFSGEIPQTVISQVVSLFFIESRRVFYLMLFIGIGLIVLGVVFNIFRIGFKINYIIEKVKDEDEDKDSDDDNISKEEVKEIVEKEVKEEVKEELSKQKNKKNTSKKK